MLYVHGWCPVTINRVNLPDSGSSWNADVATLTCSGTTDVSRRVVLTHGEPPPEVIPKASNWHDIPPARLDDPSGKAILDNFLRVHVRQKRYRSKTQTGSVHRIGAVQFILCATTPVSCAFMTSTDRYHASTTPFILLTRFRATRLPRPTRCTGNQLEDVRRQGAPRIALASRPLRVPEFASRHRHSLGRPAA